MTERRFTDRDVALILRRATELAEQQASSDVTARGLSLHELQEIAAEVGIEPEAITRAVAELEGRRGLKKGSLLGPALANRQIRTVPAELKREALGKLVRTVDRKVPAQGTIAEALGHVRWSAPGLFLSRQVSLEPSEGETLIRVEERYAARFRRIIHALPTFYGLLFGWVIGLEGAGGIGPAAIGAVVLGAGGWALARGIWGAISARSRKRTDALADELARQATDLSDTASLPGAAKPHTTRLSTDPVGGG